MTSGVVYPGAVLELATRYRFERVGGTSAGAIAAALVAAAEYGRQRAGRLELRGFLEIVDELRRPGFILSLFQPASAGRALFDLSLALSSARRSRWQQTRVLATAAVRHRPLHVVIAALGAAGVLALLAVAFQHLGVVPTIVIVLLGPIGLILLASWAVLAPLVSMLRSAWRTMPEQGFGLCPGTRQDANGSAALTDWLHAKIQQCAELPLDRPLTFAMLEQERIGLQMVGTDLGMARPVTIPFAREQYLFSPSELARLFPRPVVEHVLAAAGVPASQSDSSRAWFLPARELPVLIGARISSSVPVLLSSLKLYCARPEVPRPIESLISDGGITSNFPIHFFDDWLPSHPTFGLDLVPISEDQDVDDAPVFMPSGSEAPPAPLAQRPHSGRLPTPDRGRGAQLARRAAGRAARLPRPRLPDPDAPGRGRVAPEHRPRGGHQAARAWSRRRTGDPANVRLGRAPARALRHPGGAAAGQLLAVERFGIE